MLCHHDHCLAGTLFYVIQVKLTGKGIKLIYLYLHVTCMLSSILKGYVNTPGVVSHLWYLVTMDVMFFVLLSLEFDEFSDPLDYR